VELLASFKAGLQEALAHEDERLPASSPEPVNDIHKVVPDENEPTPDLVTAAAAVTAERLQDQGQGERGPQAAEPQAAEPQAAEPQAAEPQAAEPVQDDRAPVSEVIDLTCDHHSLRGQVRATTGEPLAGATITLVSPDGQEAGHAVASDDGSFTLPDVAEGTYTLVAVAPSYHPSARIVALKEPEANATVSLLEAGSLTGTVTRARNGSPLEAHLDLLNTGGGVAMQCQSGQDGTFLLPEVLEGDYQLVAHLSGYRSATVHVTLRRGAVQTTQLALTGIGHLYGAVSGPGGGWLPGVTVALIDDSGAKVATTSTDGAGSYHFADVLEGSYTLRVAAPGAATATVEVGAGTLVAADLTLDAE
jgi:hypothetical protein